VYLGSMLHHLGLPPTVIALIMSVHEGACVGIVSSHGFSDVVHLHSGVRQGKIESPLLLEVPLS
jgi:hypothetical protein